MQRSDVRAMAALTVGVCLGCVCGLSLTLVAAKWLHGQVADLVASHDEMNRMTDDSTAFGMRFI